MKVGSGRGGTVCMCISYIYIYITCMHMYMYIYIYIPSDILVSQCFKWIQVGFDGFNHLQIQAVAIPLTRPIDPRTITRTSSPVL